MTMVRAMLLVAGVAWLVGCSGAQPMEYHSLSEIPPGPGLFTGESGEKKITVDAGGNTQTN